ncbi:MAG: sialate O-acetylesterase [Verrucomicrobiales bacterium]|nr:sialate O-acetylesterase [Verrucomicrobiales bacterium]
MNRLVILSLVTVLSFTATLTEAGLKLPSIFGHHMVLQRDMENPMWGWAEPDAKVIVTFAGQDVETKADAEGYWKLKLPALPGSNHALQLKITTGSETLILSNIVMGEVWVCSGQSNMQWSVAQSFDPDLEIPTANYPNIRLISVPQVGTQELQNDFVGQWEICTPDTISDFSAVGYFYGRQLHQTLGVPIGLIDNAWGGSAAEAWVDRAILEADPDYADYIAQWEETEATFDWDKALADWKVKADAAKEAGKQAPRYPRNPLTGQHRPGNLWNGVLNPIIGYGIRGAIWYQGESNAGSAYRYDDLFGLMITEWRKAWAQGDFPFYWVQLADFRDESPEPGDSEWAELREAQTNTLELPNTGQAVIYDIGEGRDIHPRDKQNVGKRLARIALAENYGKAIPYLSPSFSAMDVQGNKAVLTFDNVGSTLYTFDTKTAVGFAVAGEDKVWHWGTGILQGRDKVVVTSEAVEAPVAVRYAWSDNPIANLMSREGLPVIPFRTDDWPQVTDPANAPEPEPVSEQ